VLFYAVVCSALCCGLLCFGVVWCGVLWCRAGWLADWLAESHGHKDSRFHCTSGAQSSPPTHFIAATQPKRASQPVS